MAGSELFGELPQQPAPRRDVAGEPRLREPQRDQLEWRSMDVDSRASTCGSLRMQSSRGGHAGASNDFAAAAAGVVAVCDQPRSRQRASLGSPVR
jgi:hypothetical protein